MDELMAELKTKVVETLNLADVQPQDIDGEALLFGAGLGLDSIDVLELIMMIERDYGVKIDTKELGEQAFRSIRTLAEFIQQHRPPASA